MVAQHTEQLLTELPCFRKAGERENPVQLKPYGTPLLSLASRENALTKGKIQCIVENLLSPFRKEESIMSEKGKSDSSIPERRSARLNNSEEDDKSGGSRKAKKSSSSEVIASKLSLQLDENNKTVKLPDNEAEAIKLPPSAAVTIYLDWTPELSGMYDITCLEGLPEVLKYGPATKKARSEPLSLYACLEAFLREEPLVPDEMWYVMFSPYASCARECVISEIASLLYISCFFFCACMKVLSTMQ